MKDKFINQKDPILMKDKFINQKDNVGSPGVQCMYNECP